MTSKTISVLAALALVGLAVGGCEDTERPLTYDKGVYGGQADQPLTEQQLEELRQRSQYQNG